MNKENPSPLASYKQIVRENKSLRGDAFVAGALAAWAVVCAGEGRYPEAGAIATAAGVFYLLGVRSDKKRLAGAVVKSYSEGYCTGHQDGKSAVLEEIRRAQAEVVGDKEKKG